MTEVRGTMVMFSTKDLLWFQQGKFQQNFFFCIFISVYREKVFKPECQCFA